MSLGLTLGQRWHVLNDLVIAVDAQAQSCTVTNDISTTRARNKRECVCETKGWSLADGAVFHGDEGELTRPFRRRPPVSAPT
jgi:hypothetical protein